MRQIRAILRILWLLDRPPARAMTHAGTLGGDAAVVGRLQADDVEFHHLKHASPVLSYFGAQQSTYD